MVKTDKLTKARENAGDQTTFGPPFFFGFGLVFLFFNQGPIVLVIAGNSELSRLCRGG